MTIKIPTRQELRMVYERDLKTSFPAEELRPLYAMEELCDRGVYRPWCVYEDGEIIGCAFVWEYEPGWVLFDYLCVAAARRNDGIGSALIAKLVEAEKGNVLFGESEIPAYAPDAGMAQRRIGFYVRNGAKKAFYDTALFGVPYHTLYWSEQEIDENELLEKHQAIYRSRFPEPQYRKLFRIPWEISMGMPQAQPWEEKKR